MSVVTTDDDIPSLIAMLVVSLISWVVVLAAYVVALVVCWARALQLYIMPRSPRSRWRSSAWTPRAR